MPTPSSRVRTIFDRIFPYFATKEELNDIGWRLCCKHSRNPTAVFKAAFNERLCPATMGRVMGTPLVALLRFGLLPCSERARINLECLIRRVSKFLNEVKDMKTTGELRKCLAQVLIDARDGKLSGDALRGVIGAANQINMSLSAEIKMRHQLQSEGVALTGLGDMPIGSSKGEI